MSHEAGSVDRTRYPILRKLHRLLIEPKSSSEDSKRREFILNVLLAGILGLSLAASFKLIVNLLTDPIHFGVSLGFMVVVTAFFGGLLKLSRAGHYRTTAYIFIGFIALLSTYPLYIWGVATAQGLLMYSLIIVMAGVLIGRSFSLLMTLLLSAVLLGLAYLQSRHIILANAYWLTDTGGIDDAVIFSFTFGVIYVVSWLFNGEIEKSLKRARKSEAALKRERDLLEVRVEQRTQQLQQAQMQRMVGTYRFVELGRLSSGLLHDLTSPLTAVSLNLEELSAKERSKVLTRAVKGIKQIENFVRSAQKQVQGQEEKKWFSVAQEINQIINILEVKARDIQVKLKISKTGAHWQLFGDHIKFYQAVTNLISNAIDAYEGSAAKSKVVSILLERGVKTIKITILNRGKPIPLHDLPKIFEPFFTSKASTRGTGLGLAITKKIVEEDFKGTIAVNSNRAQGTSFILKLPATHRGKN